MPEYNYSFDAALKNALDYLFVEWRDKPVGFVSYGGVSGGLRTVQQLKPVISVLGMPTPLSAVVVPFAPTFLDESGKAVPDEERTKSAAAMLDELADLDRRMRPQA